MFGEDLDLKCGEEKTHHHLLSWRRTMVTKEVRVEEGLHGVNKKRESPLAPGLKSSLEAPGADPLILAVGSDDVLAIGVNSGVRCCFDRNGIASFRNHL